MLFGALERLVEVVWRWVVCREKADEGEGVSLK